MVSAITRACERRSAHNRCERRSAAAAREREPLVRSNHEPCGGACECVWFEIQNPITKTKNYTRSVVL